MKYYISNDTLYKIEKESQRMRMGGGSWSISLDKLPLENITHIVFTTPLHTYRISKDLAFEKGWQLTLQGERKLIVPIKFWKIKGIDEE